MFEKKPSSSRRITPWSSLIEDSKKSDKTKNKVEITVIQKFIDQTAPQIAKTAHFPAKLSRFF
jgi:hypothetical protein